MTYSDLLSIIIMLILLYIGCGLIAYAVDCIKEEVEYQKIKKINNKRQ